MSAQEAPFAMDDWSPEQQRRHNKVRILASPQLHHARGSTDFELTLSLSEHSPRCQSFCNHSVIRIRSSLPRHTRCHIRARLWQPQASTCHHESDTNNTSLTVIHGILWHTDDFQCLRYSTSPRGRSSTLRRKLIYQARNRNIAARRSAQPRHHSLREATPYRSAKKS